MQFGIIEVSTIIGAITTIAAFVVLLKKAIVKIIAPIKALHQALDKQNSATCAALKYSISRAVRGYKEEGKIDRYALQCILDMHREYKELGGNGFIDILIKDLQKLPVDMKNDV